MLIINADDIRALAPMPRVIEALRRAFCTDYIAPAMDGPIRDTCLHTKPPAELELVLQRFNDTTTDYPAERLIPRSSKSARGGCCFRRS